MEEVLMRQAEMPVPLPAREAARMRHKRNRAPVKSAAKAFLADAMGGPPLLAQHGREGVAPRPRGGGRWSPEQRPPSWPVNGSATCHDMSRRVRRPAASG